ncbi:hypothetical protein F5X68DRAFT_29298 [Plectosphaerella plurivora]|uniref:F-box domain-containing protein n=1 Tax=Plectosphaerella plurivora TaxID=936078 RepID=A0A9P9AG49_9PEZI|nr:hypothetical protein F5X68DRAFT_29298 [Plectosphaerella plurivora]
MLSTLPADLLIQILDKTDFDSHLNLALTCRRFSACLEPTLARHRDVHQRCRHMSSAAPRTIRDLVRSVIGLDDPIYAWNVRTLDIWYYDESYPLGWSEREDENRETVTDFDTWWPWQTGEKDAYCSFLHQYFVPDKVKKYMDLVEIRELSFLRTVLFYTLPRLREIRFRGEVQTRSGKRSGLAPTLRGVDAIGCGSEEEGGSLL